MKLGIVATVVLAVVLTGVAVFTGCAGGGGTTTTTNGAFATVSISDPATCQAPNGSFSAVYVTVKDVVASTSSTASASDTGSWVDLTPNLSAHPMQINLLGIANNTCFLAMLGSQTELQPGQYQQIRIILLDNNSGSQVSNNQCTGTDANCVVLASGPNPVRTLQLSSEAQTGIKVPSGQIAGGAFVIGAGQTKDLNIDFNTCASIVVTGNGYRLKPVLHAGEVSTTSTSINGTVVDSVSMQAISGTVVVALEQKDPVSGIDRVVMQTLANNNGQFVFCPVPAGMYDVVVGAITSGGGSYAPSVLTGVQPGNTTGQIPMIAVTGTSTAEASIAGLVTTSTGSAATAADISLSALQSVNGTLTTVPLASQSSATLALTTASGASCPANTDCVSYTMSVPAALPNVGAYSTGTISYTQGSGSVDYTVDAQAFVVGGGTTADCNPSDVQVNTLNGGGTLTVTPGASVTAANTTFTGCQ